MNAKVTKDPLDRDGDGEKGAGKPGLVWIVTRAEGLQQVPTGQVDSKISDGKGRRATDRDLAVAGIIGASE